MKKTFLAAAAAIVISVSATVATARLLFVPQGGTGGEMREEAAAAGAAADNVKEGYYISGYEGVLAVYREADREKPLIIFEDVYLHSLPEYDRRQLEEGVYAESYAALSELIEDYIS